MVRLLALLVLFSAAVTASSSFPGGRTFFHQPTVVGVLPCRNSPMMFNFGDGNSDTGGSAVLRGTPLQLPEGRAYFRQPTGRRCDGRLLLDFLCESLGTKYLTPYFELAEPDFSNGVNFALNGSEAFDTRREFVYKLKVQIDSFTRFYNISITSGLISGDRFRDSALYMFDIGQNDIDFKFDSLPYDTLLSNITAAVSEFRQAIQTIYGLGGRMFWIHNVGPVGCLPKNVASRNASKPLDANGCIARENEATAELNAELEKLTEDLRSEMSDATIVYVDIHAIKLDLIVNSAYYGFGDAFRVCFDKAAGTVCSEEEATRFVSWDGVHYTEAANMFVAAKVLSNKYSNPPLDLNFFCN